LTSIGHYIIIGKYSVELHVPYKDGKDQIRIFISGPDTAIFLI